MPPRSGFSTRVGAVLDHEAAGRDAGHGDVRLEGMSAGSEPVSRNHMNPEAPSQRHIEPSWKRRETRVGFDLQLMACDQHSVEAQSGYPRQHRGTRAVL